MATATLPTQRRRFVRRLGAATLGFVRAVGDLSLFSWDMLVWLVRRPPRRAVLFRCLYNVGVKSISVVVVTGAFIGMVLAVQSYDQFRLMRMESRLGAVINVSLAKELGPVLAATMLAGRVGSAIAAELGTMRVTEQIDALRALGTNPIQYLVVPRFLACFWMIPLLTALADAVGMLGGWFLSTRVLGVDSFYYWYHARNYVAAYDVTSGVLKSFFFGAAIALIACHRGFRCRGGAEGVGRAATEAFVFSFVAILVLDFFLGMFLTRFYYVLWPTPITLI